MSQGLLFNLAMMLCVGGAAAFTAGWPWRSVALAGGLALGAGMLHRLRDVPKWTLFAVIAMVPLDYLTKLGGGAVTFTKLLFPIGFGLFVLDRTLKPRPLVWSWQCVLVAAFGLSVALSLLTNPIGEFARHSAGRYAGVFLLFFLAVNVLETERDLRWLLIAIVVSCVVSAAVGALGFFGSSTGLPGGTAPLATAFRPGVAALAAAQHTGRLMGLSSVNPNTFGAYLLTAVLIVLYFLLAERRVGARVVLFGALLLLAAGIAMTLSRGVSLVAALCVPVLFFQARRRGSAWQTAGVLALLLACLLPLVPWQYYDRLRSLLITPSLDHPLAMRHSFNLVALQLFASHPILGLGPGGFSQHFTSQEFRYIAETFGYWKVVHNLYLAVACHMGVVGLTIFGAVVWRAFADLRFVANSARAGESGFLPRAAEVLRIALLAFLLNAFFLPAEHEKYMWVLFAACTAMAEMRRRELREDAGARIDRA